MAKLFVIIICAVCCVFFNRTLSAPIIKASGIQWSEPKGTGKGNITLIMIPQNNSAGNDSDMIVAVKSDYQIVSQDTQLLNLVVNENINNRTNSSKLGPPLQKYSSLKEESADKQERELLRPPNTAKYFEPEKKIPADNTTNNTVNIYPLLVKNYQNLVALNATSTTILYNTINVFQLLSMSASNNNNATPNHMKVVNGMYLNTATSKYNNVNLTEPNNYSPVQEHVFKSNSDNVSLSMVDSDDHFLNEALNILEKIKQDPSYYNKFKSNQIPSTEEIKDHGEISLTDSKTKFLKSDDSALASDDGEGLGREFGHNINNANQGISNLEGNGNENIQTSTCLPFFMSVINEQATTQLTDLNNHKEVSFENVPLGGTGSNASQEFVLRDNASSSDKNLSVNSKCKPSTQNYAIEGISQTTITPVESRINISVGYGVQSNDSLQTLPVKSCKPSGLSTVSNPLTTATSQTEHGAGSAESIASEPNYLQQTLAAGKLAAGAELSITDSSQVVTASIPVTMYGNNFSSNHIDCVTSTKSSVIVADPYLQQANKAPSAGEMKSPEQELLKTFQPEIPVTKTDRVDQSLQSNPTVPLDGTSTQNVPRQNELDNKSTECMSNALIQTVSQTVVSPASTVNVASGLIGLPGVQTECPTDPNVKQESGLPQAGVGAIPKKITLEPQVTCGTVKKEDCSTLSHIEGQDASFKEKDLTLPLVRSSIFLANNNEMPKGKDIPISLNASLDEFGLSDLQEREDRMHGKVAELYNRNPLLFNVGREPTILKPELKYNKKETFKSPTLYFNRIHRPDSNQILKMNFAGKNVVLEQRPSYKSEKSNRICNNTLDNNNKLTNYDIEPNDNDIIDVKLEPIGITTPQIIMSPKPNVYGGNEQKYLGSTIKSSDSHQPANEEEKLLTILNVFDKTTSGTNKPQETFTALDFSTIIPPDNNMNAIPTPVNDDKVFNPQELVQNKNNLGSTTGRQDSENVNSQLGYKLGFTTKHPSLPQKLYPKPTGRLPGRLCSKSYKTKTSKVKTVSDFSKPSSSDDTDQETKQPTKENMCIPADSLQKIVIEIVRNTKKPDKKLDSYAEKPSCDKEESVQNEDGKREEMLHEEMGNIKQNFVPFQSAWKPVQSADKQTLLSDSILLDSVYSNENPKDSLKIEISESDGVREKYLQNQNSNRFVENQHNFKQERLPTVVREYNSPFHQTEKSLGANILKLLMAEKSAVKSE